MPSDFSGLDNFTRSFPEQLKAFAQEIAEFGEDWLKNHDVWDNGEGLVDTGALRASVTGYGDGTGDPFHNHGDAEWQTARREGNINGRRAIQAKTGDRRGFHYNPPENYDPVEPETISSDADAVAIVTAWVRYGFDEPIAPEVASAFMDTLNRMAQYALSPTIAYKHIFEQPTSVSVFTKLNSPSNPNQG